MKKIIVLIFSMFIITVAVAQSNNVKKQYELRLEQQKKELDVTDEQAQKVIEINKLYHRQLQVANNDKSLTKEQREAKAKDILKERMEKIKEVLTAEQFEKYRNHAKEESDKLKAKSESTKAKSKP